MLFLIKDGIYMSKTIKKVTAVALSAAALTLGAAQTANADTVAKTAPKQGTTQKAQTQQSVAQKQANAGKHQSQQPASNPNDTKGKACNGQQG